MTKQEAYQERLLAHQQALERWRKAPPTPTAKRMIHVCETAIKYLVEVSK